MAEMEFPVNEAMLTGENGDILESFYRNNVNFQRQVGAEPAVIKEATLDEVKSSMTDLNKSFMLACTQNLRDVGHSSCLVPVVADYLTGAISIMSKFESKEGLKETGLVLQEVVEHYYGRRFGLENPNPNKSDSVPSGSGFKSAPNTSSSTILTKSDSDKQPNSEFNLLPSTTSYLKNLEVNSSATGENAPVEDEDEMAEQEAQNHEMTPVVEEDAIFSIKCKLFEKLLPQNSFTLRGIGVLYLKQMENGHQILVWADNSVGNILLNLKLDPDLPMTLRGNKIIAADPYAKTPLIIRVKSEEDSKRLFHQIMQC